MTRSPRRSGGAAPRKDRNPDGLDGDGNRPVYGLQAVREVIRAWGARTRRVVIAEGDSQRLQALARFASDQDVAVESAPRAQLDKLAQGGQHQGAFALAPPLPLVDWETLTTRADLLAVALDGVTDPHNFGATIRSAVGVADAAILWAESSSAPLSPTTFRSSAGAIEHATLCRVRSLHGALGQAAAAGIEVVGLAPEADEFLHEADIVAPCIVVIGSEEKGMARAVRRSCTRLARLHQARSIQSLNASVAAGIALHTLASKVPIRG